MKEYPADFWNELYNKEEFRYGTKPNRFFKQQLDKLKLGSILLPAEGEGRNAVYAASIGWNVTAFDISERGKEKALRLAKENDVSINYQVSGVLGFKSRQQFNVIGFSYAHFPADIRKRANQRLLSFLKSGGTVIFEGFAKAQLGNVSGGPKNKEMLFSIEDVKADFSQLEFKMLREEKVELAEGKYHKGKAVLIRFVGIKK